VVVEEDTLVVLEQQVKMVVLVVEETIQIAPNLVEIDKQEPQPQRPTRDMVAEMLLLEQHIQTVVVEVPVLLVVMFQTLIMVVMVEPEKQA
tara:strand:- start:157 stop:429 length:273 start_codon:yes stop_codon:yes gene_type:complete